MGRMLPWLVVLSGCAAPLLVSNRVVETRGRVRVVLREPADEVSGNRATQLFEFDVVNEDQRPLIIDRDAVLLKCGEIERARIEGGIARTYVVPPGQMHALNVEFHLPEREECRSFLISFNRVFAHNGEPVHVAPMSFVPYPSNVAAR